MLRPSIFQGIAHMRVTAPAFIPQRTEYIFPIARFSITIPRNEASSPASTFSITPAVNMLVLFSATQTLVYSHSTNPSQFMSAFDFTTTLPAKLTASPETTMGMSRTVSASSRPFRPQDRRSDHFDPEEDLGCILRTARVTMKRATCSHRITGN